MSSSASQHDPRVPFETEEGCVVEPLDGALDVEAALARLAVRPHCLLLDSARRHATLGRYSFLMADPFEYLESPVAAGNQLAELENRLKRWSTATLPGLPPFQGGAAGLFSYDMGRWLERVPPPQADE